jgi:hypothetical protein
MNAMNKLIIGLLMAVVTFASSACVVVPLGYPGDGHGGGHHRHGGW